MEDITDDESSAHPVTSRTEPDVKKWEMIVDCLEDNRGTDMNRKIVRLNLTKDLKESLCQNGAEKSQQQANIRRKLEVEMSFIVSSGVVQSLLDQKKCECQNARSDFWIWNILHICY